MTAGEQKHRIQGGVKETDNISRAEKEAQTFLPEGKRVLATTTAVELVEKSGGVIPVETTEVIELMDQDRKLTILMVDLGVCHTKKHQQVQGTNFSRLAPENLISVKGYRVATGYFRAWEYYRDTRSTLVAGTQQMVC